MAECFTYKTGCTSIFAQICRKGEAYPIFLDEAFNEKKSNEKYYLVLADSGMGKTTFLVNLFVRYNSFFRMNRPYAIRYIPFASGDVFDNIRDIKRENAIDTILLLDAFDEYAGLLPPDEPDGLSDDERFRKVLDELFDLRISSVYHQLDKFPQR